MPRTLRFLLLALGLLPLGAAAQTPPRSERLVSYRIHVRLDAEGKRLLGRERITWRNPDRAPVSELQFHLYLNGFEGPRTTFMREGGGAHRGFSYTGDAYRGHTTIRSVRLAGQAAELSGGLRFLQPDDGNPDDRTVAALALPAPVAPGETVALDIRFEAQLPRVSARTGWALINNREPFFMVGQWFPKLGVLEPPGRRYVPADAPRGRWNTHQFHLNSEFYADFGVYDVTIDAPRTHIIGATGVRVAERVAGERRLVRYRAADVHDFAWTSSPAFEEVRDAWRGVALRLLVQPQHRAQAERHFTAVKHALEMGRRWLGPYPYPTLTLVDGVGGSNGMEYPTLITCGTAYRLPENVRALEQVVIHEFFHQYFYGLLASNEAEEAWLDEGFTSYLEAKTLDAAYGPGALFSAAGIRIDQSALNRGMARAAREPLFRRSWAYADAEQYGLASYPRSAVVLASLERLVGEPVMRRILQTYFQRRRFGHPTTRDFRRIAEEVSGQDLAWFFRQYVYGAADVDYAVEGIAYDRARGRSAVTLVRKAPGVFPVDVQVRLADGRTARFRWSGAEPRKRLWVPGRAAEAFIDPDDRVWLDENRLNNRLTAAPDPAFARGAHLKLVGWLHLLISALLSAA